MSEQKLVKCIECGVEEPYVVANTFWAASVYKCKNCSPAALKAMVERKAAK
jgi:hypothetical protein